MTVRGIPSPTGVSFGPFAELPNPTRLASGHRYLTNDPVARVFTVRENALGVHEWVEMTAGGGGTFAEFHVAKGGSDLSGDGSDERPFLTIQKAFDTIGNATTAAEFSDETIDRYLVHVHPGVYTQSLTAPVRADLEILLHGAKIIGDVFQAVPVAVLAGPFTNTKLKFAGNDLRNAYDNGAMTKNGIQGDILIQQVGAPAPGAFLQVHLINTGVNGNVRAVAGPVFFFLQLFCENAIVTGDVIADAPNAITLYIANSDTSNSFAFGGTLGSVLLNVLRNVRFLRPVITSGGTNGTWHNVLFRPGAHDFTGASGNYRVDHNSFESYLANVPTKGAEIFTLIDVIFGTTLGRPTAKVTTDGTPYWDSTLDQPIWRRAASATGWCFADGTDA